MSKVCPSEDLPLQGLRHVRHQTGPAQRVAELLYRTSEPSVLPVWLHLLDIGTVAVRQSRLDVRMPSDADLYRIGYNRHAARRLHRYLLSI